MSGIRIMNRPGVPKDPKRLGLSMDDVRDFLHILSFPYERNGACCNAVEGHNCAEGHQDMADKSLTAWAAE